jgi:hypothetical protein
MRRANVLFGKWVLILLLGLLGGACSRLNNVAQVSNEQNSGTDSGLQTSEGPGILIRKAPEQARALAVMDFKEVPTAMSRAVAAAPSFDTITVYQKSLSSLSLKGDAESISAPMWMAMGALAANFCQDRINLEKNLAASQRLFFNSITDFTKPMAETVRKDVKERLVINILKRPLNSAVEAAFTSDFESSVAGATAEQGALMYCTGILASLGAQVK